MVPMSVSDRRRAHCLVVPKSKGEQFRLKLDKLAMRDLSLKIRAHSNRLLIPLKPDVKESLLARKLKYRFTFGEGEFEVLRSRGDRSLETLLEGLSFTKSGSAPRAYDIIGDIALIEVPPDLKEDASTIGQALLALHKRLRAVYAKAGAVTGDYRLRQFRYIAGEQRTDTIHRENDCQFKVNIATTFFNPRLAGERLRVARQVSQSEMVLDMFAGVGPYSILIARLAGANVYAIDSNPEAVRYLRENVRLNHVEARVEVVEGDAAHPPEKLYGRVNRVIMNLPERAGDYLAAACKTLKPTGGTLHFYTFQEGEGAVEKAERLLSSKVEQAGSSVRRILLSKAQREIGARAYQVVVDAKIAV